MTASALVEATEKLEAAFSGKILTPGDPDYDGSRRIHNGLIDKRPALIARCPQAADVVDVVNFGREDGLEISVRGGGHNVAGKAVTDRGLMIDLPDEGDPRRPRAAGGPGATGVRPPIARSPACEPTT